jgi:hypothetical protein
MKPVQLLAAVAALGVMAGGAHASTLVSSTTTLPADVFTPPNGGTTGTVLTPTGSVAFEYASPFSDDTSQYVAVQNGSATYDLTGNTLSFVFGSPDTYNTISFLDSNGNAFDTFVPGTGAGAGLTAANSYFVTIRASGTFNAVEFSSTGPALEFSNVAVSNVPLPASAPMFGAALLALGAIGYGVKRKSKAAAAA